MCINSNENASKRRRCCGSSILQVDFLLFCAKIPKLEPSIRLKYTFRMPNKTKYPNLKWCCNTCNVPTLAIVDSFAYQHTNNAPFIRIKYIISNDLHWIALYICIQRKRTIVVFVLFAAMTFQLYILFDFDLKMYSPQFSSLCFLCEQCAFRADDWW